MLEAIIQLKWWASQEYHDRAFTDILYDWESPIGQYSPQSGEAVSDSIKCVTILKFLALMFHTLQLTFSAQHLCRCTDVGNVSFL